MIRFCLIFLGALAVFDQAGAESDIPMLSTCVACHGQNGVSPNDEWPNLVGQKKTYLINQLKLYKSGERYNPLMSPVAKMLSEKEMKQLAEYYSALGNKQ